MSTAMLEKPLSSRQATARSSTSREATARSVRADVKKTSPTKARLRFFFRNFKLAHSFTIFGFLLSLAMIGLFTADLVWGWPLFQASIAADVLLVLSGLAMLYACVDVFKEQTRQYRSMLRKEYYAARFNRG